MNEANDWLFWNVDTQFDFVSPKGKLYVPGAELLKHVWGKMRDLAKEKTIRIINTCDYHMPDAREISNTPDFIHTFPPHCMAGTPGAEFVSETKPEHPFIIEWDKNYNNLDKILDKRLNQNIVIRKDVFDVFEGNHNTKAIIENLSPKNVVVYGVTTNVCVNFAVIGLVNYVDHVYVISDAIKELPNIPLPYENWKKLGVKMITYAGLKTLL